MMTADELRASQRARAMGILVHYGDRVEWLASQPAPIDSPWVCGAWEGGGTSRAHLVTCPACCDWLDRRLRAILGAEKGADE